MNEKEKELLLKIRNAKNQDELLDKLIAIIKGNK